MSVVVELKDILGVNPTQTVMAGWGAVLSTILGFIKIYETWRSRHRVDLGYSMTSDEVIGNSITIRNLSNQQLILIHWELFIAKHRWSPDRKEIAATEFDVRDIVIAANSSITLRFVEEDYFDWSSRAMQNRSLFIKLSWAGRKPKTYLVYPQNHPCKWLARLGKGSR
ncbi:hypothetical protein [Chromobacterium violaceum]|uniref:hypothetical protein n=1 Tax=Chromobacterium violaceum TaxID=536 RepID=UPI0012D325C7|nr:hypothetical protein [Chromobacterium violaceum]